METKEQTVDKKNDLFDKCSNFTAAREVRAAGLYPYFNPISSEPGDEVVIGDRKLIMIGSNNYLGLVNDMRVKEAAADAARKYGSGCTGSRFLNGTLDLHIELEAKLAEFLEEKGRWFIPPVSRPIWGRSHALRGKMTLWSLTARSMPRSLMPAGCLTERQSSSHTMILPI